MSSNIYRCEGCGEEFEAHQLDQASGLCEKCYIEQHGDVTGSDFEPYSPRCWDD